MAERLIEVCDKCYRASCWHGEDLCDHAAGAGTTKMPENQLRAMGFEHPSNFSKESLRRVFGDGAPHGYAS